MNVKEANREEIQSRRKLKTQVATSFYAPAAGVDANKCRAVFGDCCDAQKDELEQEITTSTLQHLGISFSNILPYALATSVRYWWLHKNAPAACHTDIWIIYDGLTSKLCPHCACECGVPVYVGVEVDVAHNGAADSHPAAGWAHL